MILGSTKVVNKASAYLSARRKELTDCGHGPLLDAKTKMEDFKVKAGKRTQLKMIELKFIELQ